MISIIICSIEEAKLVRVANNYAALLRGEEFEIIGIRDAKSLCEGYNRGFRLSKGSLLVFSHDDIEILSPDFAVKLRAALKAHDVVGVAGTTATVDARWSSAGQPHLHGVVVFRPSLAADSGYSVNLFGVAAPVVGSIQSLDGMFIAARREVVERVGFDETTFDGFHGYDADFSFSAYLAGFRVAVSAEIIIAHQSQGNFGEAWAIYNERFVAKHQGKLYAGKTGPRRAAGARLPDVAAVLRFCDPARMAEVTAKIRSEA